MKQHALLRDFLQKLIFACSILHGERSEGAQTERKRFYKLSPRTSQRSPLRPKEEPLKGPAEVWRGPKGLPGKRKEFEGSKQLQLGGIGISCQHLQVLMGATPAETFRSGTTNVLDQHGHQYGLRRGTAQVFASAPSFVSRTPLLSVKSSRLRLAFRFLRTCFHGGLLSS